MNEKIIYSLNIKDVQTVAKESFGRKLKIKEIQEIEDLIAQRIDWYSIISDSIQQLLFEKKDKK